MRCAASSARRWTSAMARRWNARWPNSIRAAVFNAAAYNQVDVAEREPLAAYEANALGVRNIALACRQNDARLIHFSTDYVFDGKLGRPYVETDPTHPLGAYAVSKLAGELYVQAYLERPVIVRTSGVFGSGRLAHGARQFPRIDAAPGARRQADPGRGGSHRVADLCAGAGQPFDRFAGARSGGDLPHRWRPADFLVRVREVDFREGGRNGEPLRRPMNANIGPRRTGLSFRRWRMRG